MSACRARTEQHGSSTAASEAARCPTRENRLPPPRPCPETPPTWPSHTDTAISGNKAFSPHGECLHGFFILRRHIRQRQDLVHGQTLFGRMPTEQLELRAD